MIVAHRLTAGYGRTTVVQDVSFALLAGELWALVGPNGSGKTTLLATLAGLIPALAGEIEVVGRPMRQWRRPELSRHLGFLPQQQGALFPYSIEEFVELGRWPWRGTPDKAQSAEATETAIRAMQLEAIRGRALTRLSGGEVQRACVAQLLAQSTKILLLDEPTAHLDLPRQVRMMALLRGLAERGQAILVATHGLELAWRYCHRLLVIGPEGVRLVARDEAPTLAAALAWAYEVNFSMTADGPRLGAAD